MKRRSFMIAAALVLTPALAFAHGPTRQKITLTTEVAADPAEVWDAIGNFQDMSGHPAAQSSTGENENAIDATRGLRLEAVDGPPIPGALYQ